MHPVIHSSYARGTLAAFVIGAVLCLAAGGFFSTTPIRPQTLDDDDCDDAEADAVPARPAAVPVWEVTPADRTLKAALTRWAEAAGWQLVWELPIDYAVTARTGIKGKFTDAVEAGAPGNGAPPPPQKGVF
ncbi:TcpQ domain-containing protein [Massilia sp. CT11-108]|uniref:TcpQ domain-containing protein n=1 Tax=Massilia sp. CT11-108 TaxID=3393900 RepID=UPI0039A62EC8